MFHFVATLIIIFYHCSGLSESTLDKMAIINPSHRQAILSKAGSGGGGDGFDMDFDAVLGDLTSAIADLESISVVSSCQLYFLGLK